MSNLPAEKRQEIMGVEGMDLSQKDFVMPFGNIDRFTGKIINSLTEEELPAEFIPLKFWNRWCKFEGSKLLWSTLDSSDPRTKECEFGPNNERPTADKTLQVLCLFKDNDIPVIITFKRTSYKTGKILLTMATTGVKSGCFEKKFSLTTEPAKNDAGQKFFKFKVKPLGKTSEEELENSLTLFHMFKEHAVKAEDLADRLDGDLPY